VAAAEAVAARPWQGEKQENAFALGLASSNRPLYGAWCGISKVDVAKM
jgi:hypothetical protein